MSSADEHFSRTRTRHLLQPAPTMPTCLWPSLRRDAGTACYNEW